jgi:hypothetical protein
MATIGDPSMEHRTRPVQRARTEPALLERKHEPASRSPSPVSHLPHRLLLEDDVVVRYCRATAVEGADFL